MDHQVTHCANSSSFCMLTVCYFKWLSSYSTRISVLRKPCRDEIVNKLDIGRVVFLIVVLIEFGGLALAMIMRGMSDHPYRYGSAACASATKSTSVKLKWSGKTSAMRSSMCVRLAAMPLRILSLASQTGSTAKLPPSAIPRPMTGVRRLLLCSCRTDRRSKCSHEAVFTPICVLVQFTPTSIKSLAAACVAACSALVDSICTVIV